MKRILLVNPWIYDFAAHDFGIRPVGLLSIAQALRLAGNEVFLIDCLAGSRGPKDASGFCKIDRTPVIRPETLKTVDRPYFRYGIPVEDFLEKTVGLSRITSIFMTSGMTYWYPGVQLAIRLLKSSLPHAPIWLGGIYPTLCRKHALLHSGADRVWKGDYLSRRLFTQREFYPAYDLLENTDLLPLRLTEGCPYRCSYCASRILKPGFVMKDPVNLFEEVMHYNTKFGTSNFVFYDDALAYRSDRGIKKFLRLIAASGHAFTFQTPNGIHARYIDDELAALFKNAGVMDIRISLETSDEDIQHFTGGKVTNNDLKTAVRNLKEAGYAKNDIGVYVMAGAPWLSIDKTINDVMFVNSVGAKAVLASYSPIPGTRDFAALIRGRILRRDTDPLWHNKTIFPKLLSPYYMEKIQALRRLASKLNSL
ncbi:MAG: B12-binding domain-containing radical SAM protein [Candidatus Omnitrophota bacterium]